MWYNGAYIEILIHCLLEQLRIMCIIVNRNIISSWSEKNKYRKHQDSLKIIKYWIEIRYVSNYEVVVQLLAFSNYEFHFVESEKLPSYLITRQILDT